MFDNRTYFRSERIETFRQRQMFQYRKVPMVLMRMFQRKHIQPVFSSWGRGVIQKIQSAAVDPTHRTARVTGWGLPVLARCVGLWLLYLRVYWELEDKQSICEYLRDPFCRLPASEVVYGTDRSPDTKKYNSNTINGPTVPFFVSTHGISGIPLKNTPPY